MTRPERAEGPGFCVAVVGSGPSGFYVGEALLRSGLPIAVDMFERLPSPYGLVRFGVAPDHAKLKGVTTVFERIATAPGFRFVGGAAVGRDVSIDELRDSYDAVVLATGADLSRPLGIPGEDLPGSHSAGDFVAWYNGHPGFRDSCFNFDCEAATVIGHGNVALDVARILAKTADELRRTDIAAHALAALAESRVREIHVVGRGRPNRAKFGAKELHDFQNLEACDTIVETRDVSPEAFAPETSGDAEMAEKLTLLRAFGLATSTKPKRCTLRFGLSPTAFAGRARVESVEFARPSGEVESVDCGLAFASVGRRTAPLDGVPYDRVRGVHANVDGRVALGGRAVAGLYVCGWSKRGASGTIGVNRGCSLATAEAVLADLPASAGRRVRDPDALLARLDARGTRVVSFADWAVIDRAEKMRGALVGKPREKFVSVADMLAVLDG